MVAIKKVFGRFMLWILGWKIKGELPTDPKYVAVIAPHTSIADILIGKLYNYAVGQKIKLMIKKEFFWFPLNLILRWWGGFPVNRKHPKGLINQVVDEFNNNNKMILGITPEGTRALRSEWKTGFYRISQEANVPIFLMFGDFKEKTVGFLGKFEKTGNMEQDIIEIKKRYVGITGYHPQKFTVGEI
jgi:1-acyl-sn-glycerol-3-phosphate acyltransferase